MTETKLIKLIDDTVALDRKLREDEKILKEMKATLVAEAVSRKDEQVATEKGGKTWICSGSTGCLARVTFPADKLKSSVSGNAKDLPKIQAAAGRHFATLFPQAPSYSLVEDFRERAKELLEPGPARKLIRLVESKSPVTVSFETKDEE